MTPPELDDKTLALLLTISDLCGGSDSPNTVVAAFERSLMRARKYRRDETKPAESFLPHGVYSTRD